MGKSKIEWTHSTWNPVTGCSWASRGCDHCYANRMALRHKAMGTKGYENGFAVTIHPERLAEPIGWHKPRRIFVVSMGDLFHPNVPVDFLNQVFDTMRAASWHQYLILTKRPHVLKKLINLNLIDWPWNLVQLGVTVESSDYEGRIQTALSIDALLHFVSIEPCLGFVNVAPYLISKVLGGDGTDDPGQTLYHAPRLDWVVLGGETGPGARPMHPDWARGPRNQCIVNNIPYFFKSWGDWMPIGPYYGDGDQEEQVGQAFEEYPKHRIQVLGFDGGDHSVLDESPMQPPPGCHVMVHVGKKKAGRLLDGREWNQMPQLHGG